MPSWLWMQEVVFPLVGMGMGALAMFWIYRTVNAYLERRHERELGEGVGGERVLDEVEQLRQRMEMIEDQVARVQDMEERLDFAERLLAQHSDRRMLRGDN